MNRTITIRRKKGDGFNTKPLYITVDKKAPIMLQPVVGQCKNLDHKVTVNEKGHEILLEVKGLLKFDRRLITIQPGEDDILVAAEIDSKSNLHVKVTKQKPPVKERELVVERTFVLPDHPVKMYLDYQSKKPILYEIEAGVRYSIITDTKKHEILFASPDVETGDLRMHTIAGSSKPVGISVDFALDGSLVTAEFDPNKKKKNSGKKGDQSEKSGKNGSKKSPIKKIETPDVLESATFDVIYLQLLKNFDEDSDFAKNLDKVPRTCFLTCEEDCVRVTIIVEDFEIAKKMEDGGTSIMEWKYSDCTLDMIPESYGQITESAAANMFDVLTRQEDRDKMQEYLLSMLEKLPHLIVEGNSFRGRRKGEELIDVPGSLTTAAIVNQSLQLFSAEGEIVNALKKSNIDYCLIAAYEDYVSFLLVDTEDTTIDRFKYTFEELVGPDMLTGPDCYSKLCYGHERDWLEAMIGDAVKNLPHLNVEHLTQVYLDQKVVSKVKDLYVPQVSGVIGNGDNNGGTVGIVDGGEEPADTPVVAGSPTTLELIEQLKLYFGPGGAFSILLHTPPVERAAVKTGDDGITIVFFKYGADGARDIFSDFNLYFRQFGTGQAGSYVQLTAEQQNELEQMIWKVFPALKS